MTIVARIARIAAAVDHVGSRARQPDHFTPGRRRSRAALAPLDTRRVY
jgi:hypothetical protein